MESKALLNIEKYASALRLTKVTKDIGKITQVTGFTLRGFCLAPAWVVFAPSIPQEVQNRFWQRWLGFRTVRLL